MKTLKLYEELKRLLEYSGKPVQGVSLTADGVVASVMVDGEQVNLFMSAKQVMKPQLKVANDSLDY